MLPTMNESGMLGLKRNSCVKQQIKGRFTCLIFILTTMGLTLYGPENNKIIIYVLSVQFSSNGRVI